MNLILLIIAIIWLLIPVAILIWLIIRTLKDGRERREMMEAYEDFEYCLKCGSTKDWVDCGQCDNGQIEEDTWEGWHSDEYENCPTCEGRGGWLVCLNCHPEAGE